MELIRLAEALLQDRRCRRRELLEAAFRTVVLLASRQRDTTGSDEHLAGGPSPPPAPGLSKVKGITYVV